jgi:hypothetical protein
VVLGPRGVGALDIASGRPATLYVSTLNVPEAAAEAGAAATTRADEAATAAAAVARIFRIDACYSVVVLAGRCISRLV